MATQSSGLFGPASATALGVAFGWAISSPIAPARSATLSRASVSSAGAQSNAQSFSSGISGNGRIVAFYSEATNLVQNDLNGTTDVFVRDTLSGLTTRLSVSSAGSEGDGPSSFPSVSWDGQIVALLSTASNLVADDTNGCRDVFVHDRAAATTVRVSISSSGTQADADAGWVALSGNGQFVAFSSHATNLVANDTNGHEDVFVHNRNTGVTARVSVSSGGTEGNSYSGGASLSGDGRFVAFSSNANNLVLGDDNNYEDVFVHDRQTGQTTLVSRPPGGSPGPGHSVQPSISGDGRFVAFASYASMLVPGDTNGTTDVFVHDRLTSLVTRVSVSSAGLQGNDWSQQPSISADGYLVSFTSPASNLGPDGNGTLDVFVHNRLVGMTTNVSANGNSGSQGAAVSMDGLAITFTSASTNLVPDDSNGVSDAFVRLRTRCPGDCNQDDVVNFADLNLVLANFGLTGRYILGDADDDDDCDFVDLNLVLSSFGSGC